MAQQNEHLDVRPAARIDFTPLFHLLSYDLKQFYGVAHLRHIDAILASVADPGGGGVVLGADRHTFVSTISDELTGMIHVVEKPQRTLKISPLIVLRHHRRRGVGSALIRHVENWARGRGLRQLFCTVAQPNTAALRFFMSNDFILVGATRNRYVADMTELLLNKAIDQAALADEMDAAVLSVRIYTDADRNDVQSLLHHQVARHFGDVEFVTPSRLLGHHASEVPSSFPIRMVCVDRTSHVRAFAACTVKNGRCIRVVPLVATDTASFSAMLHELPHRLSQCGEKLYTHMQPTAAETAELQKRGWTLDALLPHAYCTGMVTQQWSYDLTPEDAMKPIRIKRQFLDAIDAGRKKLEVRVGYPSIRKIRAGDNVRFYCGSEGKDDVRVKVRDVRKYMSFEQMLDSENHSLIAPGQSKSETLSTLRSIYSDKKEALGVFVFDIEPLPNGTGQRHAQIERSLT